MGKLKKVGIGFGVPIISFFALVIIVGISNESEETRLKNPVLSADEIKSQALTDVSYDDLFRNNEQYVGKIVYYEGRIIQAYHVYDDKYDLRIAVTNDNSYWSDVIYSNYAGHRVLQNDIVEFWGEVKGVKAYTAVLGDQITIPEVDVLILNNLN